MLFNSFIAAAILASTAYAYPAGTNTTNNAAAATTTTTGLSATGTTLPPPDKLLTQKLFLADTAADRFALLPVDRQFVFDFGDPALKGKGGAGGDLAVANRKAFPALVGTGSGMAVGFLNGCGFNTPHVHPRATELQIVINGTIITEMVPENGVLNDPTNPKSGRRVITNTLTKFQMQPFYQGSVHTQFNPSCEPATFIASFNSEDFGAGQVLDETFTLSSDVVQAAFGQQVEGFDVAAFKGKIPVSIAKGVEACLAACPGLMRL